jgi:mycothiol system anti-sigma-R factor
MKWMEELRRLLRRAQEDPAPADPPGGISCQAAVEHLFEWLDGELEPEMGEQVAGHLEACARCYPLLTFERAFRQAVTEATGDEEAPDELKERIMASLESEGYRDS